MKPVVFQVTNNLDRGGVQMRLLSLLPRLVDRFEMHVITYSGRGMLAEEFARAGIALHHIPLRGKWNPVDIGRMALCLRRHKADIVNGHSLGGNIAGILAGALARTPVRVGQVHTRGLHWYAGTETRRRRQRKKETWVHRHFSQQVVCVSEECREYFLDRTGLPPDLACALRGGVELSRFAARRDREGLRREFGIPSEKTVVGFVGRLVKGKGLSFLFNGIRSLGADGANLVFAIAGDGPEERVRRFRAEAEAVNSAGTAGPSVMFLGECAEPERLYPCFDAFCFPSEPRIEGFGGVLLEAAACGLPILSRRIAPSEELRQYYPRVHRMAEDESFLSALNATLALPPADPEVFRREFGIETLADRTADLYLRLLREARERKRR